MLRYMEGTCSLQNTKEWMQANPAQKCLHPEWMISILVCRYIRASLKLFEPEWFVHWGSSESRNTLKHQISNEALPSCLQTNHTGADVCEHVCTVCVSVWSPGVRRCRLASGCLKWHRYSMEKEGTKNNHPRQGLRPHAAFCSPEGNLWCLGSHHNSGLNEQHAGFS